MGVPCKDVLDVAKISPSSTTLNQLMVELAAESVLLTSTKIQDKTLGLICDKGKDYKNGASFVKLVTYSDEDQEKLQIKPSVLSSIFVLVKSTLSAVRSTIN